MTKFYALLFLLIPALCTKAGVGTPETEWLKTIILPEHKKDYSIQSFEEDDGYVYAGYTEIETEGDIGAMVVAGEFFLAKTNMLGEIIWHNTFTFDMDGYDTNVDQGCRVVRMNDGNYLFARTIMHLNTFNEHKYFLKVDKNGTKLWEKAFSESLFGNIKDVVVTENNGFFVLGIRSTWTPGSIGGSAIVLLKFDASGEFEWEKNYDNQDYDDVATDMILMKDGKLLIGGFVSQSSSPTESENAILLMKKENDGSDIWTKIINKDTKTISHVKIDTTKENGFIVSYNITSGGLFNNPESYGCLLKTNSIGEKEWFRDYSNPLFNNSFHSINSLDDGGFIITGKKQTLGTDLNYSWILRTNNEGNIYWEKENQSKELDSGKEVKSYDIELNTLIETSDNGYFVSGFEFSNDTSFVKLFKLSAETNVEDEFDIKQFYGIASCPTIGNYQVNLSVSSIHESERNIHYYEVKRDNQLIGKVDAHAPFVEFHNFSYCDTANLQAGRSYNYAISAHNYAGDKIKEQTRQIEVEEDTRFRIEFEAGISEDTIVNLSWKTNWEGTIDYWLIERTFSENNQMVKDTVTIEDAANPDSIFTYQYADTTANLTRHYMYNLIYSYHPMPDWNPDYILSILADTTSVNIVKVTPTKSEIGHALANSILNNFPNPFKDLTSIRYTLLQPGHIVLRILDSSGKVVDELLDQQQTSGVYQFSWEAKNKKPGIYFLQLKTENSVETKKMILIR